MNQNWSGQSGSSSTNIRIQNFLEALRNTQTKIPKSKSFEGRENHSSFSEFQIKKEVEKRRVEQFQNQRYKEWNSVFSAKESQTEKRIEEIRKQLVTLSHQVKELDTNLTKAIMTPIPETGEYQLNYLEHLKKIIHLFSLRVNQANSWLEIYQNRSKKMSVYWGMAKSKGTSFTQNNERNIATSVG